MCGEPLPGFVASALVDATFMRVTPSVWKTSSIATNFDSCIYLHKQKYSYKLNIYARFCFPGVSIHHFWLTVLSGTLYNSPDTL